MLCRIPTIATTTLDAILGPDADKRDMGVTTQPTNVVPPTLNLKVYTEEANAWKVKCTLTPAVEGTNRALYLGAGTYPTGMAWWPQSNGFGPVGAGQTEIYAIVDAPNSDWSRRAEIEHCDDWILAHQLTLLAAENAIRYATSGLENRRFENRQAAYQGAREAFVAHSPHSRIAAVFEKSIIATSTQQDFFPQEFKKLLTQLFMDVGDLTAQRDQNRWHHFEWGPTVPSNQLGVTDRMRTGRDYRRVQRSAAFSVGMTTSAQLIRL